ncbi:TetR/AcrR family transcriptional regulator [Nonomuraea zeae]|uniref:TetR/AcrR family transcriptional regulator n=1 Tax=Nonomuraea zeae TaxID=1642303 RepID=A0A5S4H523_9ACTN|nr:TetR/AcrR family transcriptional regulator [Nonomuraea zeae]TMR39844.1 TetR/AcrR family transcriptional regulator [Nonomuraea zeae]
MTPQHSVGRRERNREAMRARVYEAAISLFAEKGYTATSFDEIADRADVARATVFNYFKRKDEFLLAWGDERRRRLGVMLIQESSRESGVLDQLTRCMSRLGEVTTHERRITSELLLAWVRTGAPVLEEPYTAFIFAQILTDGKARGEVRPDIDAVAVGHLLRDMYLGTLYRWVGEGPPPFPLAQSLTASLRLIFDGILPEDATVAH